MPSLGNGPPLGLPATPLGVYSDVRTYDTKVLSLGVDDGISPITRQSTGPMSPYAKVIAATPGLASWHRLNAFQTVHNGGVDTPGFYDSVGSVSMVPVHGSGSVTIGPGLVPGDRGGSAWLKGGDYVASFDYGMMPMGIETILSCEFWVYFDSVLSDVGLFGAWGSSNGWMVYSQGANLQIYSGGNSLTATGVLSAGKLYHVVGVWGGSANPTGDHQSRIYLNGVKVAAGNLVQGTGVSYNTAALPNLGQYGSGAGANSLHGRIQEISVYNRMLQPLEVTQHYQAGFARA